MTSEHAEHEEVFEIPETCCARHARLDELKMMCELAHAISIVLDQGDDDTAAILRKEIACLATPERHSA